VSNSKLSNSKLKIVWSYITTMLECDIIPIINSSKIFIKSVWHLSCKDLIIVRDNQFGDCFSISFFFIYDHVFNICILDQCNPLIKWGSHELFFFLLGKLIILCQSNERVKFFKFIVANLLLVATLHCFSLDQLYPILKT
jgi:hypothetical protein